MNRRRWFAAATGVTGAVAIALGGGAALRFPVERAVAAAGSEYALVAGVGFVGFALGIAALAVRTTESTVASDATGAGSSDGASPPGAAFDRFLRRSVGRVGADSDRSPVCERLRSLAVLTVEQETDCDRSEARRRVAAGTWTDDPAAASFLGDPPERPSARVVLAGLLRGETPSRYLARHTASTLVDRHDEEGSP